MKKILLFFVIVISIISCNSSKGTVENRPLFEVLRSENNGGADFQFYEILTTEKEIKMILNDPLLKKKVSASDAQTSNFLILNLGTKDEANYGITVESARETPENIVVKIKHIEPQSTQSSGMVTTKPFAIVRINSKKPIIFE